MEQVLKLDKDCEEAVIDLFNCKVLQLMVRFPFQKTIMAHHLTLIVSALLLSPCMHFF